MAFELDEHEHERFGRTAASHRRIVTLHALKNQVSSWDHYPVLVGHPAGRKVYPRLGSNSVGGTLRPAATGPSAIFTTAHAIV